MACGRFEYITCGTRYCIGNTEGYQKAVQTYCSTGNYLWKYTLLRGDDDWFSSPGKTKFPMVDYIGKMLDV